MRENRIALFDNVKGIAIALVVIGHFAERLFPVYSSHFVQTTMTFIYIFHMPLFIFCSGLFAGRAWAKSRKSPTDKVILYLALYLVFLLAVAVLSIVLFQKDPGLNPFRMPSAPWFMFVLAILMLMVPLIGAIRPSVFIVTSIIIAVLANYYLPDAHTLCALRLFVFLPYFALGFYLQPDQIIKVREIVFDCISPYAVRFVSVSLLIALFIALYLLFSDTSLQLIKQISSGANLFSNISQKFDVSIFFLVFARVMEYPVVALLVVLIFFISPEAQSPLTVVGQRSFQVYMLHMLIVYTIAYYGLFNIAANGSWLWLFAPWIGGAAVTALLSVPKAPASWIQRLGVWCKWITSDNYNKMT